MEPRLKLDAGKQNCSTFASSGHMWLRHTGGRCPVFHLGPDITVACIQPCSFDRSGVETGNSGGSMNRSPRASGDPEWGHKNLRKKIIGLLKNQQQTTKCVDLWFLSDRLQNGSPYAIGPLSVCDFGVLWPNG